MYHCLLMPCSYICLLLCFRSLLFRQILPGLEPLLNSLSEIAQRRRKTLPQVAINWCICNGAIPIPGVKTIKQADENLGALGWRLSSDELIQLEYSARESPQKMIQNIFQTRYAYYYKFTIMIHSFVSEQQFLRHVCWTYTIISIVFIHNHFHFCQTTDDFGIKILMMKVKDVDHAECEVS